MRALFDPKSIAIVGISANPNKIGSITYSNLMNAAYKGKIYFVNPNHKMLYGKKVYASLDEIKDKIDLCIIATPASITIDVYKQCCKKGVKYAIIFAGGFESDKELEKKLKSSKCSTRILGPNCLGIINRRANVDAIFFSYHRLQRPNAGHVSILSQSGAVGSSLIDKAADLGIGINKFVSYGNAYDIQDVDLLNYLINDKDTKVIVWYLESTKNGDKLLKLLKNNKKPIIAIKAGKTKEGNKAAKTHTGAIVGDYLPYKALFSTYNIIEAKSLNDIFNLLLLFSQPLPKGKRLGIITNGGGLGVISTDIAIEYGLKVPNLSKETVQALSKVMPFFVVPSNPLDVVADADEERYMKGIKALLEDKNIDIVLVNVLFQSHFISENLVNKILDLSANYSKPIVFVTPGGKLSRLIREMLIINKIPAYGEIEHALKAIRDVINYSLNKD